MLITPASASEPYCAEAPSRSTSMWSMAPTGMVLMLTPCEPWPTWPRVSISALECQRLPSTRISTWSLLRPRIWNGRTKAKVSDIEASGKFNEGTARSSALPRLTAPESLSTCAGITSTGTSELDCVRSLVRVPVTITCDRLTASFFCFCWLVGAASAGAAGAASCAAAVPASTSATDTDNSLGMIRPRRSFIRDPQR